MGNYSMVTMRLTALRIGILVVVYAVVLGLPFYFGYISRLWVGATAFMAFLATIGPFTYNYLRERAEAVLLREQKELHTALRELAKTMTQIKQLDVLLKAMALSVGQAVKAPFTGVYVFEEEAKGYILKYTYGTDTHSLSERIPHDAPFIQAVVRQKKPLLSEGRFSPHLPSGGVGVPYFREEELFGLLIIGPKPKSAPYTPEDISEFDILASETTLAIENCFFWEREKGRLVKEEQIRRQRAMDHFSASLAHEIDNPIYAVVGTAEVIKMVITEDLKHYIPPDKITYLTERLEVITKDLLRISKVIKAIREFSGQTKGEFTLLKMDEVVGDFLNIIGPQFKYEGVIFGTTIEPHILVKGNKIHLEEVLVNFATNAMHAVKFNRKDNRKMFLRLYRHSPDTCMLEFKDNGYGIKKELLDDIFLDFVTTKASTEGAGMGLARVRKIIGQHKGRVWARSEGEGKGATFFVELPIAKEHE